ncbi:MAG: hypothetical protein H6812_05815 [Phycisphaeraceae bacterium]|nr:hypothetical protein [Phycisphaerales bacterium]MCB9842760.1 hypothetical protein [Phycisphaeraceae bacterium]
MAFIGGIIPTGPGGANPNERTARKKREELRKGDDFEAVRREADKAQIHAAEESQEVEHARPVRETDSEESREDQTEHNIYGPLGRALHPMDRNRLDLEG